MLLLFNGPLEIPAAPPVEVFGVYGDALLGVQALTGVALDTDDAPTAGVSAATGVSTDVDDAPAAGVTSPTKGTFTLH